MPKEKPESESKSLERERVACETARVSIEADRAIIDGRRTDNDRAQFLLSVVQYLNSVQDGEVQTMHGSYENVRIERKGRILNCHEEDLYNAALIKLKGMVAQSSSFEPTTRSTSTTSTLPRNLLPQIGEPH